jgi:hypothetical protein
MMRKKFSGKPQKCAGDTWTNFRRLQKTTKKVKTISQLPLVDELLLQNYVRHYLQKHLEMKDIASTIEPMFLGPPILRLRSTGSLITLLLNW